MAEILRRIGGPNGITFAAWLILAPISLFLTQQVVPEGIRESPVPGAGLLVGLIGHVVAGVVLFAGKLIFLREVGFKPRPVTTLAIMLAAGMARGLSVSFALESLQLVESADYFERMRSGAVLIVVWFSVAALVIDSRSTYRKSYENLNDAIDRQLETRLLGEQMVTQTSERIVEKIKETLHSALMNATTSRDLHNAVDDLVRPLSHRLATESEGWITEKPKTRRRIRVGPVIQTAFSEAAFNPLPTATVAVFGTITSLLWSEGPIALLGAAIDFAVIIAILQLAKRLRLTGLFALLAWFTAGFASAAASEWLVNPDPWADLSALLLLSINVVVPAALLAFLAAYQKQAEMNLERLRENFALLELETQALKQRLWIEQKRLARFVHSELQARLRAFALRMEFEGQQPSEAQMRQLKIDCESALVFDDEAESFQDFFFSQKELWQGVIDLNMTLGAGVAESLSTDTYAAAAVKEVVRETIINAVKHGKASKAQLDLTLLPSSEHLETLNIVLTNDGSLPEVTDKGLGSAVLEELVPNALLRHENNQTVFEASLPIRPNFERSISVGN